VSRDPLDPAESRTETDRNPTALIDIAFSVLAAVIGHQVDKA
jgi:hypothetical protein